MSIEADLAILDEYNIVYRSINIILSHGQNARLKKKPKNMPTWPDTPLRKKFESRKNATVIPTGLIYNLLVIDIDNYGHTLELYDDICKLNGFDGYTLTMETINKGFHQYFRLTDAQRVQLQNLAALNGKLFNLTIDVKHNKNVVFGPSEIEFEGNRYGSRIIKRYEPAPLPNFIFNEIMRVMPEKLKVIEAQKN